MSKMIIKFSFLLTILVLFLGCYWHETSRITTFKKMLPVDYINCDKLMLYFQIDKHSMIYREELSLANEHEIDKNGDHIYRYWFENEEPTEEGEGYVEVVVDGKTNKIKKSHTIMCLK